MEPVSLFVLYMFCFGLTKYITNLLLMQYITTRMSFLSLDRGNEMRESGVDHMNKLD